MSDPEPLTQVPNPPEETMTAERRMFATLGARDDLVSALRRVCWQNRVSLDMTDDSGWFETLYYLRFTGARSAVQRVNDTINYWIRTNG